MRNDSRQFPLAPVVLCAALLVFPLAAGFDRQKALTLNKQGEKLLEQAQFKRAIDVFTQMRDACGNHEYCRGVALFYLGRAHLELSRNDDALQFFNQARDIFTALGKTVEEAKVMHAIGRVYAARSEYGPALREYESAYTVLSAPQTRDDNELFLLLANKAQAHIALSHFSEAGRDLNQAERLFPNDVSEARIAALSYLRGQIQAHRQYYRAATSSYERALRHYKAIGNRKKVQSLLNNLGIIAEHQSNYESALSYYRESLRLAKGFDDPAEQAVVLNNLGSVNWKRGNYEEAAKLYTEALTIYGKLGKSLLYADTLNNLGIVYMSYGAYGEAFRYFSQSYDIAKQMKSYSLKAWTLNDMAWVLKDQGNLQESKQFYLEAVDLARRIGDRRQLSTILLYLGNLYEYYGDFDRALRQYQQAKMIQEAIGNRLNLSNTLYNIANIHTRRGESAEATSQFEKALKIKQEIGAATGEILSQFALFYIEKTQYMAQAAQPAHRQRDLALADRYIKEAQAVIGPENKLDRTLVTYVKGKYLVEVDPAQSVKQFNSLHKEASDAGSLKYAFLANVGLGLGYESQKKWTEAESAFQAAVDYAERIRKTLDPVAKRAFLEGEEILGVKHLVPYEGLARVRQQKGDLTGSLDAAEFTKARSFADKISQRLPGTSFGVAPELLNELDTIEAKIRANHRRMGESRAKGGDSSLVPKLVGQSKKLESEMQRVEQKIQRSYPTYSRVRSALPIPLDQSALRNDETVLAYEVTDSGVIIYFINDKRVEEAVFKPISRERLDSLVRKLREPLVSVTPAGLESFDFSPGKDLYDLLVKGFLPRIKPGKPLIVMPDDILAEVPFEMLVMKNDGGRVDVTEEERRSRWKVQGAQFLADRNPITYYQSVTALTLARMSSKHRGGGGSSRVLLIADPILPDKAETAEVSAKVTEERKSEIDKAIAKRAKAKDKKRSQAASREIHLLSPETFSKLSESFQPLPETRKLAREIRETFGDQADVYTGRNATLSTFDREIVPKIGSYGKIVFATHGYFGDRFLPEVHEPILVLSLIPQRADNLLRMSQVMGLNLDANLVSLIACQTGLGRRIAGEGIMGMGRAFQYAGAKSVLMSLWSVDERPSVEMARVMLDATKRGATNLEALQAGRKAVREQGWDHPFFWAGFVLVGESK